MRASRFFIVVASLLLAAVTARAQNDDQAFREAVTALSRGAYTEAIDRLEALADRGAQHPDMSFDRALAYVGRARSLRAEPGDLGRAAAALEEALLLRPGDEEAEHALEVVRSEIARRHARRGTASVNARPSLGRAIATLVPENAWALVGALGSLACAIGFALRRFTGRRHAQLTGSVMLGTGALLFIAGLGLAAAARHLRLTSTPAVVIAEQARLLDESGRALATGKAESDSIPEGARVWVTARRGGLSRLEWGSSEGWVVSGQVRELSSLPTP